MFESASDVLCPVMMLLALIAVPIAWRYLQAEAFDEQAARRRRLAQVRTRRCLGCGYDIHASEFRCPECGRVIVSEAAVMGWIPPDAQAAADALEHVEDDREAETDEARPPPAPARSAPAGERGEARITES